jgi:hypothetical protein
MARRELDDARDKQWLIHHLALQRTHRVLTHRGSREQIGNTESVVRESCRRQSVSMMQRIKVLTEITVLHGSPGFAAGLLRLGSGPACPSLVWRSRPVTGCNARRRCSGARIESAWCGKILPIFITTLRELPLLLTNSH